MAVFAGIAGAGDSAGAWERHCRAAIGKQRLYAHSDAIEICTRGSAMFAATGGALARPSPLTNPDISLVADIRLDNRSDVVAALGRLDSDWRTLSDPDLLLVAWSRWGEATLDRIVGSFAFAVHDGSEHATYLVRDAFGERPLNFGLRDGRLSFASMPSGVWPAERLAPDLPVLAGQYRNRLLPPDQSNFRGITRVAPGHVVRFQDELKTRRYWNPQPRPLPKTYGEIVEAFRSTFDEAVGARLSSRSTPNSSMLSSGFDSSSVTGTAARLMDAPELLTAYTSAPAFDQLLLPVSRFADETEIAAKSVQMLGIGHRIVRDRSPILSSIRGVSEYFQAPAPNPVNFGWWRRILDDVRESGQSSLLVAVEGNFTVSFGGMMALPAYLRGRRPLDWFREARQVVRTHEYVRWRGALFSSFEGFVPLRVLQGVETLFDRKRHPPEHDFIHPDFSDPAPPPAVRMTGDLVQDRLALLSLHDNGERYKGMAALTGVEERDPTVDRRFVELCLTLRPEHLLKDGEPRPLAREALSDRMHPQVFDYSVRGVQSADWYCRLSQSEAAEMLDELRTTSAAQLLDIPKMQAAIDHWPAFDPRNNHGLTAFGRGLWWAFSQGLFVAELERAERQPSPSLGPSSHVTS